jgi:hypothetical protein
MRDLIGTAIDGEVLEALTRVVARQQALVFLDEGSQGGVGTGQV